ncbi:ladderlectin-like [Centropristis striata]|uniref:ladderlectin-like n=1 Tax=Centropristis striata TaxID=184440 RepID=UPI0027DFC30A|nr:ladderlectin-like [Centropristis striata]
MKTLTVTALLCAVMALTTAATLSEVKDVQEALEKPGEGEHQVVKRSTCCPGGWRQINGRCFLFVKQLMNWAHAERNCQSLGANLASVHQALEQDEIRRMIRDVTHGDTWAWIGGADAEIEGCWLWSDGTPFTFSHWCHGQPDNWKGNEHCIQINWQGKECWNDLICHYKLASVCAKNI